MIHHVTRHIRRPELERCVSFYEILGFQQVTVPEGIAGRALWLERAHTQIHLMPNDDASPEQGHIGVVVQDYKATVARLRAEGHETEPRREYWGSPRAYVRDPAGNLVELMAWPPGPAPAHP